MIAPDTALAQLHQLRQPAVVIAYAMHAQRLTQLLPAVLHTDHGHLQILPGPDSN